jgi:hypothetical protein
MTLVCRLTRFFTAINIRNHRGANGASLSKTRIQGARTAYEKGGNPRFPPVSRV